MTNHTERLYNLLKELARNEGSPEDVAAIRGIYDLLDADEWSIAAQDAAQTFADNYGWPPRYFDRVANLWEEEDLPK